MGSPEETSGESNVDNESDDEDTAEPIVGTSKRRMAARDLAYVYPSRRTISRYLEDASYMNLLMVAEELVNKGDNVVKQVLMIPLKLLVINFMMLRLIISPSRVRMCHAKQ